MAGTGGVGCMFSLIFLVGSFFGYAAHKFQHWLQRTGKNEHWAISYMGCFVIISIGVALMMILGGGC